MAKIATHSRHTKLQIDRLRMLAYTAFPPWSPETPAKIRDLSRLLKRYGWIKHLRRCSTDNIERVRIIHLLRNSHAWAIARVRNELESIYADMTPSTWIQTALPEQIIASVQAEKLTAHIAAGRPTKYPKALAFAIELLRKGGNKDFAIYRKCKEKFGDKEDLPPKSESFMSCVRRHLRNRHG